MIVRTAPDLPAQPDTIRAMERLEAQLRRAADDLAEALEALREQSEAQVALAAEVYGTAKGVRSRCNAWMPSARERCARWEGHRDSCRTRAAMDSERDVKGARRKAA